MKRTWIFIVTLLLAALFLISACTGSDRKSENQNSNGQIDVPSDNSGTPTGDSDLPRGNELEPDFKK
ncbi:MAG: hypothetical protein E7680_04105 [Ruminococcaceae bacterium]|nr:hypothetical protein [Oscillospiraceae bacterium]